MSADNEFLAVGHRRSMENAQSMETAHSRVICSQRMTSGFWGHAMSKNDHIFSDKNNKSTIWRILFAGA